MLSVETSDVSRVPGNEVCRDWNEKLCWFAGPRQSKTRSHQKNWAPTLELSSAQRGFSGSTGGFTGFGPTWQKAQDMPTR